MHLQSGSRIEGYSSNRGSCSVMSTIYMRIVNREMFIHMSCLES
jgi:hypothetical protein